MKVVDAVTIPLGELETVDLLDYQVPREIVAHFLIKDESPINRSRLNWSVEMRIKIGDLGTPILQSLTHRGLSMQQEISVDAFGNYISTSEHSGVSRKQIALVEKNLGDLIDKSLSLLLVSHSPAPGGGFTVLSQTRKVSEKELLRFRKEMKNRSAKTKLTPEFLLFISKIYLGEVERSKKAGDRSRTTEVIWEATGFQSDKKTVEAWVAKARREEGFLPPSGRKKVSAKKAGSKPKTKAKKGE